MNVWIVSLVDRDSCEIKYVCEDEEKAKEKWQEQIDELIEPLKDMLVDKYIYSLTKLDVKEYKKLICMYENLTLDNIDDANYSYYIPIIKKYEVI